MIDAVHDYAQVYLLPPDEGPKPGDPTDKYPDRVRIGTLDRHYNQTTVSVTAEAGSTLSIWVENSGRLNSTRNMRNEWKGIKSATLAGKPLTGWTTSGLTTISEPDIQLLSTPSMVHVSEPYFGYGSFRLEKAGDAFLDVSSLGKGVLWINGKCSGRFWNIGPQMTL